MIKKIDIFIRIKANLTNVSLSKVIRLCLMSPANDEAFKQAHFLS